MKSVILMVVRRSEGDGMSLAALVMHFLDGFKSPIGIFFSMSQKNAFGHSKIGNGGGDPQKNLHKNINFKISSQRCFLSGHFLFIGREMRASRRPSTFRSLKE